MDPDAYYARSARGRIEKLQVAGAAGFELEERQACPIVRPGGALPEIEQAGAGARFVDSQNGIQPCRLRHGGDWQRPGGIAPDAEPHLGHNARDPDVLHRVPAGLAMGWNADELGDPGPLADALHDRVGQEQSPVLCRCEKVNEPIRSRAGGFGTELDGGLKRIEVPGENRPYGTIDPAGDQTEQDEGQCAARVGAEHVALPGRIVA